MGILCVVVSVIPAIVMAMELMSLTSKGPRELVAGVRDGMVAKQLVFSSIDFHFPMHILAVAKDLQFLTLHLAAEGVRRGT